jgi:hypothetical protein
VKPGLGRQRAADRRRGDVVRVEERSEAVEELLDRLDPEAHAAQALECVAHELHAGDLGREAVDHDARGGEPE